MEKLGYPLTWRTRCFIQNGQGCGRQIVFAHTNGFGDFVLFDDLGWPWPVHQCYVNRFCVLDNDNPLVAGVRPDAVEEFRVTDDRSRPNGLLREIRKVAPEQFLAKPVVVFGYVQDYVEDRVAKLLRGVGTLGEQYLMRTFGQKRSQITVITSDFESFTSFADLRNVVIQKRDMIAAQIRSIELVGVPGKHAVFICDEVRLVRGIRPDARG